MSTRTIVIEGAALLLLLASVPRWALATERAGKPPVESALSLWNEGQREDAMTELKSVIEDLERGDVEEKHRWLGSAYFLLGLMQLSVADKGSARESFVRAGVDPAQAFEWEDAAPAVLRMHESILLGSGPKGSPPESQSSPTRARDESREEPELDVGRRIRAELSGAREPIVGSLSAITDRTLVLVIDEQAKVGLPRARIEKLEVSYGRRGHSLAGLVIGAGVGALLGALEKPDENCAGDGCLTRAENIGYGALGTGVVGGLVGALIRTDRWVEIPSDRIRLRLDCGRGRAGVQVEVPF